MLPFLQDDPIQLTPRHVTTGLVLAVAMLAIVVEMVRRRKLREEYAYLWIATAVLLTVMALESRVLHWFQDLIGAKLPTSALYFGALIFLMLLCLQFSVRISKLTFRNKSLGQRLALLEHEVERLRERDGEDDAEKRQGGAA